MELILLRHGIPVEPESWAGDELARPLTSEGRSQVRSVIEALKRTQRLNVNEIWSSPLARAEQTARIAADTLGAPCRIAQALASGAELFRSLPSLQGDPTHWPKRLLCVGHQPDLGNLIATLTGTPSGNHALGRSGIAKLKGKFAAGGMKLEWLLSAEEALSRH